MSKLIISLLFICLSSQLWSQEDQQEKLQQRKELILKEIRANEALLKEAKKKEKTVTKLITIQGNKIKLKENLINTTAKQTKLLENNIYTNQLQINHLNVELEKLKADYSQMILKSYKSRSQQSRAMFLLSSENFLQAYKRAQYMKQYASYRKMQGEEINIKTKQLNGFNEKISVQKTAKQKLIEENEKERLVLEKERQEQEVLVNSIKKDKKKLIAQIRKREQESRSIDRRIDRMIREAIAEANRKAALALKREAEANKKANPNSSTSKTTSKGVSVAEVKATESTTKMVLTTEGKIIADNFKANKGRLPWPVEKGMVYSAYGEHAHPEIKSIIIKNSGVDISTEKGSNARAVFGGAVHSILEISPTSKTVLIQHGDYFTVYSNLSSVYVNKGDKVQFKQAIGKVRTNDSGKTILKFSINQSANWFNPAIWINNM
jgi:septal ring factor EnvC (AmiA/AmiB activator)